MRDDARSGPLGPLRSGLAPERQAMALAIIVCLALMGVAGWRIIKAYDLEIAESRVTTSNLARSLAEQAVAVVTEAEIVLTGLSDSVRLHGLDRAALQEIHRSMMASVAAVPVLHHLVLFSESGDALTASYEPIPPVNVADRAYFAYHRSNADDRSMLGAPVQNRADGRWSLTLSRRVAAADGTFAGVVVAVIDCGTFLAHYRTMDVGPHGTITLLDTSNQFIVRFPEPVDPGYHGTRAAGAKGSGWLVSPLDGIDRYYTVSQAGNLPLNVIVARAKDDILAVWRRDSAITIASCLVFSIVIGLLARSMAQQIKQRAQQDETVRRSEGRYRLLAEHSTDVIVRLDLEGRRQYVSPSSERLLGYRPEELINGDPVNLAHPEDASAMRATIRACIRTGTASAVTVRVRRKDGAYVWVESVGQRVDSCDGSIFTLRDATSRKQAEMDLLASHARLAAANQELERLAQSVAEALHRAEAANRAKSRFLASMSHELRTPLNGILGYTHLLRLDGGLSAVQSMRVEAMLSAGSHLLQMINRVLDISEVESDTAALHAAAVDPYELGRMCLDLVRPGAEAKRLTLAFSPAPALCPLMTDPTRLRQVLLNLLGNAVKFTSTGSVTVRIDPLQTGSGLHIEVVDTGPGIPSQQRHRLFKEFERLEAEGDTVEGAGLGLALSARLVKLLGGRIGFNDNPVGGSVFWIEIPSQAGPGGQTALPCLAELAGSGMRSARILGVDDTAIAPAL